MTSATPANASSPQPVQSLDDYRSRARRWLAETQVPIVPLDFNERFAVLRQWQKQLFDAGWLGINWSADAGGQNLTPMHKLVFAEELASARAPQPIGLIGLDVVGPSIDEFGAPWQRKELLPKLLSGEHIWCQGFSEPDAGSDLASLNTKARVDGDSFLVNGQKVWTSWANQARWCALLARTDPEAPKHKGISYILVDMDSPGITVRPLTQMTGDQEFCEVFFENVVVPRRNVVGKENEGWALAMHTLGTERAEYTVRRRVEYAVALEDAIAELSGASLDGTTARGNRVACALGDAYVAVRVLDAQTRRTIARLVDNLGPTPDDSVDKLLLNDVEQRLYSAIAGLLGPLRAVQGSHPIGLDSNRWVHEHLYSRAVSIYGGTSQIQRNIIAERLLGLPRD